MALCWARAVRTTTRTTTGTQDISVAGFGTVKGAIIVLTRATSNGTPASHAAFSVGYTDMTNHVFQTFASEDNVADSNSGRQSGNDSLAMLIKTDISGYDVRIEFSASITDGIRLNYTTVDGIAHFITVILLGGPDTSCFVGSYDAPDGNPFDVTTVGFMPDCVLPMISNGFGGIAAAAPTAACAACLGFASEPSSGVFANRTLSYSMGDAKATATPSMSFLDTDMTVIIRDATTPPFTTLNQQRMTARLSNGFTSDEQISANPGATGFMALRFGGVKIQVLSVNSPTSNGDVTTSTNYPVGSILILGSQADAFTAKGDSQAGGWCFGFASKFEQFATGIHEEDAAATMNNGSLCEDVALSIALHNGSGKAIVATAALTVSNFTLSFTTTQGTARKQAVLVIPQADFTSTGSGSFPLATGAGTASLTFQATGAGNFPLATGAGTAQEVFQASGAGTFPLAEGAGTALEVFQATGAGTFPLAQGAGVSLLVFQGTGVGSFPLPLGAGTASLTFQAVGAGSFPLVQGAGTAQLVFLGTGVGSFPLAEGSAVALLVFQGVGVGFFPLPTALGFGPPADSLACEELLEGDYVATDALGGDRGVTAVLSGDRSTTSTLLANYSIASDLQADYETITDLEGDNC